MSLVLLGGVGYMALATPPTAPPPNLPLSHNDPSIQALESSGRAFATIAKKIAPAVVSLKIEKKTGSESQLGSLPNDDQSSPFNDDLLRRFFGDRLPDQLRQRQPQKHTVVGQGSGFVVSSDGYILTNHHVAGEATKVIVKFSDGREMTAKLIGSDPQIDVAVIKVDAKNLTTLPFGDSTKTEVGEWVLASGAPFGLTQTITAGIVSAVGRNSMGITSYENFIQTDAAINPGNSGGPLVNLRGEVIGINTAIFSRNGGSVGLGFAIPIDMAKQDYEQIVAHGSVARGYLGVMIQGMTPEMAEHFGLKDTHGILVGQVEKGTPSDNAGLKQGDVIVALDGKTIEEVGAFRNAIGLKSPGAKVNLTVLRDGRRMELTATLGKLPEKVVATTSESAAKPSNSWGFSVQPLTPELAKKFSYTPDSGVIISEVTPDSPASDAGLEAGMLIQEVNRKSVHTMDQFNDAIHQDSKSVLLLVSNGTGSKFVVLKSNE